MITDTRPNVVSEVTVNGTNGKRASSSLSDVSETGPGIGLVPGNSRRFDIDDALWNIRVKFTVYLENGGRALNEALGIGRILDRIKRGIRSGARGFPDTTWEAWCIRAHAANELPFARRQADHYIQLWNHRGEITFEDDAASLRAGIAIIRGDSDGKTRRERWRAVYRCPPGHGESSADANGSGEAIHLSTRGRVRVTWSVVDPPTPPQAETTADQHDARFRSSALRRSANRTQADDTGTRDGHRQMESTITESMITASMITASKIGDVTHAHDAVQAAAKALALSLTDPEMARKINQWLEKCAVVKQSRDPTTEPRP